MTGHSRRWARHDGIGVVPPGCTDEKGSRALDCFAVALHAVYTYATGLGLRALGLKAIVSGWGGYIRCIAVSQCFAITMPFSAY